jgi:hypothetical protein
MKKILLDTLTSLWASLRKSTNYASSPRGLLLIPLILVCFAYSPQTQAAPLTPDPGGPLPVSNTADGQNALLSITTGIHNTAIGFDSLLSLTDGNFCTAVGSAALILNTGSENTATGAGALLSNTTGEINTANGTFALFSNTIGFGNTAVGATALLNNTGGGGKAGGSANTAVGVNALGANTTGAFNTAVGLNALANNIDGVANAAFGREAGSGVTTADNVICIGAPGADVDDSCYIGNIHGATIDPGTALPVGVDATGKLGTILSSQRFKHDIKPMDKASEAILAFKPVMFHYNRDAKATPQYGLIAEEVAEVNPDLVVRDKSGEILTVRYDQVNAMLLNEFLKEHRAFVEEQRKVQEQEATITKLKSTVTKQEAAIAQQRTDFETTIAEVKRGMETVVARFKEQDAKIQRVSEQIDLSKPAAQVVSYGQ